MRRVLDAELRKLTTIRVWAWLLIGAVAITALYVSLQIAFADDPNNTWTLPLHSIQGQRTLLASAASAAAPLAAVLGAVGMAGEFRHRTATPTFLGAPHRSRVIAAKLVTYAIAGAGYAAVCLVVAVAIASPWLAADGIRLELSHPDNLAALAGVTVAAVAFGTIGVGLGALLRDQVATIVGLLIYLFVVEPILTGVGSMETLTNYLPGPARNALTGTALTTRGSSNPGRAQWSWRSTPSCWPSPAPRPPPAATCCRPIAASHEAACA